MRVGQIALVVLFLASVTAQTACARRRSGGAGQEQVDATVQGNTEFALNLYASLRDGEGNLFLSPYSISSALAMTYAGARGQTEAEMRKVLCFSHEQQVLHRTFTAIDSRLDAVDKKRRYELMVANRLWGQKGYQFLDPFLNTTKTCYGAELATVDFIDDTEGARKTINAWIEKQTKNRIKDLLKPGVLQSLTRLVLTNAIYFKGQWESKFDKERTKDAPFMVSAQKKVTAPMMYQKDKFKYMKADSFSAIELPYNDEELSMLIFLPNEIEGLAALEEECTPRNLKAWTEQMYETEIEVFLPKFDMACEFRLKKVLEQMGIKKLFSEADLTGMANDEELYVSAVVHKAFVEVSEEGTEAAAATAVVVAKRAMIKRNVFRADHPFLFLIRDNKTGSILFIGRLVEPKG